MQEVRILTLLSIWVPPRTGVLFTGEWNLLPTLSPLISPYQAVTRRFHCSLSHILQPLLDILMLLMLLTWFN